MLHRWLILSLLLLPVQAAWGLTSISVFKTFTAEILTVADLNSSFARLLDDGINPLIARNPGDSTSTVRGIHDSLDARTAGNNIGVVRSLIFRDQDDSLVVGGTADFDTVRADSFTMAQGNRATFRSRTQVDTLLVGSATPTVGFVHSFTPAGARTTFSSLVAIDSLRVRDSLQVSPGASAFLPRLRSDTLLVGSATPTVGFSVAASTGQRATFGSLVAIDSLRVRDSLQISPGARAMLPRARIDTLLVGSATPTVGYSDASSAGQRTYKALLRADTITVFDSLLARGLVQLGDAAADNVFVPGTLNDSARVESGYFLGITGAAGRLRLVDSTVDTVAVTGAVLLADANVAVGGGAVTTFGLGVAKASASPGIQMDRTVDVTSTGRIYLDANGELTVGCVTNDGLNFLANNSTSMTISAAGVVNIPNLTASQDVQTDGSKNLVSVSDSTWKNNRGLILTATPKAMQLKPRYWTWKRDASENWSQARQNRQPRLAGFYAQEVYAVFPEGSPGGANVDSLGGEHWGLNSIAILALITKAVQEQQDTIDSLRTRIQVLEAR